jgi:uncharacterized Tic20 family protein
MSETGPVPPAGSTPPPGSTPPAGGGLTASPAYTGPEPDKDAKTMGMLAHLLGIIGFIGPLIIWLIKKENPYVEDQAREALNFQLTILIGWLIAFALSFVMCLGVFLYPVLWVLQIVFSIIAALKANQGIVYRYPFNIRFIKGS